jgi:integrase
MSIRKRTWDTKEGPKKGSAWFATVPTRERDAHGRIVRTTKTFRTQAEAKAWVAEATVSVGAGTFVPTSKSINVEEAARLWLARGEGDGLERSTLVAYRIHLRHIVPRLGVVKLSELTTPAVEAFRDSLLKDLSPAMARKVLQSLKALLADAVRRGLAPYNAAAPTQVKADKRGKRKLKAGVDFPTPDEVGRIIRAAPEGKSRAILMMLAFAGLRSSELRGLRWVDINLDKGTLTVEQRADAWGVIGAPKSESGHRTIPIGPLLVNTLRQLKVASTGVLVFPTATGRPIDHNDITRRIFHSAQIAAFDSIKYSGLHKLRHFAASWMLHRREEGGLGLTLKQAQVRLGHATMAMTADTYGHLLPVDDDGAGLAAAERHLFAVG